MVKLRLRAMEDGPPRQLVLQQRSMPVFRFGERSGFSPPEFTFQANVREVRNPFSTTSAENVGRPSGESRRVRLRLRVAPARQAQSVAGRAMTGQSRQQQQEPASPAVLDNVRNSACSSINKHDMTVSDTQSVEGSFEEMIRLRDELQKTMNSMIDTKAFPTLPVAPSEQRASYRAPLPTFRALRTKSGAFFADQTFDMVFSFWELCEYHTITTAPQYRDWSFEELRVADYRQAVQESQAT